jgi:hypothetical protein
VAPDRYWVGNNLDSNQDELIMATKKPAFLFKGKETAKEEKREGCGPKGKKPMPFKCGGKVGKKK